MIKFDPFKELEVIQNKMNELFEKTVSSSRIQRDEIGSSYWHPNVDIYETDSDIHIEAELPGMVKEDISITIEENVLVLQGERKMPHKNNDEHFLRIERTYGPFSRSFELPEYIDKNEISAEHVKGVLIIKLPKKAVIVSKIGIDDS